MSETLIWRIGTVALFLLLLFLWHMELEAAFLGIGFFLGELATRSMIEWEERLIAKASTQSDKSSEGEPDA